MHDIVTQRLNQFLVEKNITYKELSDMKVDWFKES